MRLIVMLIITITPLQILAQAKTSFGSSNASRCFQESNTPFSDYGAKYCTDAIRHDQLLLRDLAATYTNRGIIYAANGKLDEAMADHDHAMLISPEMAKIYVNRGNVFHQIHEYDKALGDYAQAIEYGNVPLDIVYYNRSLTLIRLKRWDDARDSLEKALEINPESRRVKRKLDQFNAPDEQPTATVVNPDGELNR